MAEGVGEEGLADADGADDRDVGVGLEEAERRELVEQGAIEGHLRGGVPRLELHAGVEAGALDAGGHGQRVPPGRFVAEDDQEEVLIGQLLLAGQAEPLGQGVEHPGELEATEDGAEVGRNRIGRHAGSPSGVEVRGHEGEPVLRGRAGESATGRACSAAGAGGGAATARTSMRCRRCTSNIPTTSARAHASLTRPLP